MTILEWVGVISMALLMPMGFAVLFMLFLQWWAEKKHLRKALTSFYIEQLRQKQRDRRGS